MLERGVSYAIPIELQHDAFCEHLFTPTARLTLRLSSVFPAPNTLMQIRWQHDHFTYHNFFAIVALEIDRLLECPLIVFIGFSRVDGSFAKNEKICNFIIRLPSLHRITKVRSLGL